jgi:alpha-methylacyl-CoA racemase
MQINRCLDDLRVLDLSRYGVGLTATMVLGDMGADVIHVEAPRRPQGGARATMHSPGPRTEREARTYAPNRNKRSIVVDLKTQAGREIVLALAETADIVYEGFRPGVATRLGVDYETLRARNPRLIYCSVSGFGHEGPYAQRAGHDLTYLAVTGALLPPGVTEPSLPPVQIADFGAMLHSLVAVLTALHQRERTGSGAFVDAAILDGVLSMLTSQVSRQQTTNDVERTLADRYYGPAPFYNLYRASDGGWIAIACTDPRSWRRLCDVLALADFHDALADRSAWDDGRTAVAAAVAGGPRAEWLARFDAADIPHAPVLTTDEAIRDPHLVHRGAYLPVAGEEPAVMVAPTLRVGGLRGGVHRPTPRAGEHTSEILRTLGYAEDRIGELLADGVIEDVETPVPMLMSPPPSDQLH